MLSAWILATHMASQVLMGGSAGTAGAFAPTSNVTLPVPAGGRFEFTSITVPAGVTVTFTKNGRNDPVLLLATGDVNIAGTVSVAGEAAATNRGGRGGPGGFDGGAPGFGLTPGDGHGPGGGKSSPANNHVEGSGAHSTRSIATNTANVYGSPTCGTLVGGSGGAGGPTTSGGGGGGGAILIASETRVAVTGIVDARGGPYGGYSAADWSGSGAGGCIRVVAPQVQLSGDLDTSTPYDVGGVGYVRIDALDKSGILGTRRGTSTIGSNMVAQPPGLPRVALVSVAGTPTNGEPISVTLLNGAAAVQPVVFEVMQFVAPATCTPSARVRLRVVPSSGPAVERVALFGNGSQSLNVTIPPNNPTSIELFAVSEPQCP